MATDDPETLYQISQLAGRINRFKNSQTQDEQTRFHPASSSSGRGDYPQRRSGWRGRGRYSSRGYARGGRSQVHRHRSLVLNGTNIATTISENSNNSDPDTLTADTPAWITKTDRHLQLINTKVFEKESLTRAKAIEETKKQKVKHRDEREKAKLNKHFQRSLENSPFTGAPRSATLSSTHEIVIQGIRFLVTKNGSKLVKVPGEDPNQTTTRIRWAQSFIWKLSSPFSGDLNAAKATPKIALVAGVRFHRSKNGNLIRHGIVQANRYGRTLYEHGIYATDRQFADNSYDRRAGVINKVDEPCKSFAATGSCPKGPQCRYIHDPSKVAVCKDFLLKGSCPSGDSCDLSHDLTPERTPPCVHFARGLCSNPNCRYTHVRVSPAAPVCRAFGIYGYCENGSSCEERHVHECPDFSNTGKCATKGCRLPHREKASVMRTNSAAAEDDQDISSDEDDEEIDSDDVDSDDLDGEFLGYDDGKPDLDMQQDFVQFS